jgi:hypothetical protein
MAKKTKTKAFSFQGFDAQHYKTTEQYAAAVDALFDRATKAIADAAAKGTYNPDKPFSFDDYPSVKAYAQKIITGLASNITAVVETGSRKQWLYACQKNDEFIASIMDTSKLSKARLKKMQDRNLDALQTFQLRKVGGMNLSQRVWKYVGQYKDQIELGLDVGLGEGRSAQQLSRDLRQNLQDPDRLFRRVRDKRGNLQLSKAAKAFHPGIGVYRSSAKNAARLTRSEINMAYREADWMRWQQLDFVVGFEVHRSNHEPLFKCDLCSRLVGRYPKTFKFKGWHPQCMCYATAILMDEDDFDAQELSDLKSALYGKEYKKLAAKNTVTDFPQGFKDWVAENQQKQSNWGSTPYFVKDNFKGGLLSNGLKKLLFVKNNIPNLVYSKESITFETSNNKNPAATEINGSIKMATAKQIFNEIDGLNPQKSTISSLGDYVSQSSQMVSDSIYKEVLSFLPKDSLAYKILTSSERYTDKQLWVISYELEKNTEFNKLITERISIRNARSNAKLEASKSKLQANKAGSQDVLDFVKNNGKRLADYYEFIKKNKKYAREFYSKKFTMESANEFLSK